MDQGSLVVVALANSAEHFFVDFAVWKLGAMVLPLRWDLPEWERQRLLHLARPSAIVAIWSAAPRGTVSLDELAQSIGSALLRTSESNTEPGAGHREHRGPPGVPNDRVTSTRHRRCRSDGSVHKVGPTWYSNNPARDLPALSHERLFIFQRTPGGAKKLVVMERFDAGLAADLIEAHRVNTAIMVPTMLSRIAELNGVQKRDFSSINAILYGGAAIASSVVRQWFSLVGPEHFISATGGTESIGLTMARGDESIQHEGTVGRPVGCEILILDDQRRQLDVGQVGNVFLRRMDGEQGFRYLGAKSPRPTADGFSTYGDLGWLDEGRVSLHCGSTSRHDRFRWCQCLSSRIGVGAR